MNRKPAESQVTIELARSRVKAMLANIKSIVETFEETTGLEVHSIDLIRRDLSVFHDKRPRSIVLVDVELDVRIPSGRS